MWVEGVSSGRIPVWHEKWPRSGMWAFSRGKLLHQTHRGGPFCHWKRPNASFRVIHCISQYFKHRLFLLRSFLSAQDNSVPTIVICHSLLVQQIICEQLLCAGHYSRNRSAEYVKQMKSLLSCNIQSSWGYRQLQKTMIVCP